MCLFIWMAVYMTLHREKPRLLWCVGTLALVFLGVAPVTVFLRGYDAKLKSTAPQEVSASPEGPPRERESKL